MYKHYNDSNKFKQRETKGRKKRGIKKQDS